MTVLNYLQSFSIIIASATAIIASGIAVYGIRSWIREFMGRKKIELSEQALALFYESRDKIRIIRSPFSSVEEGSTRKRNPNETEEQQKTLDQAYVVFERYKREEETFNKIFSLKYRFMALFGAENEKPFDDLKEAINEIFIASQMLGTHYWKTWGYTPLNGEELKSHLEKTRELEGKIWAGFPGQDVIEKRVESIISKIENIYSKYLKTR